MAGLIATVSPAEVTLAAATAKTVAQLVAAANHRVKLLAWGVYFEGVSPTGEPVDLRLLRQTTAGTMSAATPVKNNSEDGETLQTTAQYNASAEPSAGDVLERKQIHPQGSYEVVYPMGQEIIIPGGTRLGIECTAAAQVDVAAWFKFEE